MHLIYLKRQKNIFNKLLKYLLYLVLFTNSWVIPCLGTNNFKEEYDEHHHIRNQSYNRLKNRINEDKFLVVLKDESEKPKYKISHYCCCENLFYLIQLSFQYLSKNNQVKHRYEEPKSYLESLPNEIIYEITTYLDPLSIVKLSHLSKKFKTLFNDNFWRKYNYQHNYQSFNEKNSYLLIFSSTKEASPLKVTLANYYYESGKNSKNKQLIKKSSLLGLPKAKKDLDENTNEVRFSGYSGSYSDSRGDYGYYGHTPYGPICGGCGAPMTNCRC